MTPLLGSGPSERIQTLHSLYASQAATLVWLSAERHGGERKPVVVGIALKKPDVWDEVKERKTFLGVMDLVGELLTLDSD
jgi:proteasome assembly chaperone 3